MVLQYTIRVRAAVRISVNADFSDCASPWRAVTYNNERRLRLPAAAADCCGRQTACGLMAVQTEIAITEAETTRYAAKSTTEAF